MATIRAIDKPNAVPSPQPCPCGGVQQPARRFEASRTVPVLCCWRCGAENPPLYATRARRTCLWCYRRFLATPLHPQTCSIPCEQRHKAVAEQRRQDGQRNRRRAS